MIFNRKTLIFSVLLLFASMLHAEIKVAVIDFGGNKYWTNDAKVVTEIIMSELATSKKVSVAERSELKKVLDEHGLNMTGVVNPEEAAQLGQFMALNKLITGTLGKLGGKYVITAKMIDMESAKIELAVTETLQNNSMLSSAAKIVARKLLDGIENKKTVNESEREMLKYSCNTKKDAMSCHKLGVMWYRGEEGIKNQVFAKKSFVAGCLFGYGKSCYYVGNMFKKGIGGNRNFNKSNHFFKKACDAGYKQGCGKQKHSAKKKSDNAFGDPMLDNSNASIGIVSPSKKKAAPSKTVIPELED